MKADFSRYLLPVLMVTAVCGGIAVGTAWDVARGWVAQRRSSRRPAVQAPSLAGRTGRALTEQV
jgi:hypothetical protein